MANIDEGSNGMSYDFGIMIAKGTVQGLAAAAAGAIALTGAIVGLVNSSNEIDTRLNKNQIAFGGYANTLAAVQFAQQKQLEGVGFATDDLIDGMRNLNRAGLDAKQNFDLVAEAASASGKSFDDIAGIIRGGDFQGLADMGIITDRMASRMSDMGYSAKRATKEVVKLLGEAKKKGMFEDSIMTLDAIKSRFAAMATLFKNGILGDPKDPEGLAMTVKRSLTKVANFMQKHAKTIQYYGRMIGLVLRTAWRMVGDFVKMIAKNVFHLDKMKEKSTKTMQDNLMSFGLWLEIQRARVRVFFEEYGKYIGWIIKALLAYKALKFAGNLWSSAINGAMRYYRVVRVIMWQKQKQFQNLAGYASKAWSFIAQNGSKALSFLSSGFSSIMSGIGAMRNGMMAFNAVALLNPIGLIVAAIALVIAGVVALIAYWDDLWLKFQDMSDAWSLLLGPLFLIIKYWEEIKASVMNFAIAIEGWFTSLKYKILNIWEDVKTWFSDTINSIGEWFSGIWESISNTFHEWFDPIMNYLAEFFQPLIDAANWAWTWLDENLFTPISDFFSGIADWINEKIIQPISNFFSGIGDFFGDLFGTAVDKTQEVARSAQDQANIDAVMYYQKKVAKGTATAEDKKALDDQIRKSVMLKNATKSNADVQKIKAEKKQTMVAEKAKKEAGETGFESSVASMEMPSSKGIDFGTKIPKDFGNMGGNTTNVQSGAVQINVGAGANIDENKLALLVTKKLKELGYQKQMREGG